MDIRLHIERRSPDRPRAAFAQLGITSRIVLAVATAASLSAMTLMIFEGFSRLLANVSFDWIEELVRYLVIWAFFVTIGIAGFRHCHIRTELLVQRLPRRVQRLCWILACLVGIAFAIILGYSSLNHLERFYASGMVSESTMELPMWLVFLAMPIGAIALFLYYALALRHALRWRDPFAVEATSASDTAQNLTDVSTQVPLL